MRTIVNGQFRAPLAEQFSLQFQRELAGGFVLEQRLGGHQRHGTVPVRGWQSDGADPLGWRARCGRIPNKGVIRERCNCTASIYHSWQTSLEKRLSRNFSMAAHYTWSSFIDGASEVFNPSTVGEIAFPAESL